MFWKTTFILFFNLLGFAAFAAQLTPPKGWECLSDVEQLPQKVIQLYIGTGKGPFTPSINIACEETAMALKEYVQQAIGYHLSQRDVHCKEIGEIQTRAGKGIVLQIDQDTQWGNVRFLQAIVLDHAEAYVITATCLQEDFSALSPHFFRAIQSFCLQ